MTTSNSEEQTNHKPEPHAVNSPANWAKAHPHKRFFLEMFTRDISVEACLLDLIDNSIDAYLSNQSLSPSDIFAMQGPAQATNLPTIELSVTRDEVTVSDNCGGLDIENAKEDAFNFGHDIGHDPSRTGRSLGAYGIGMNRALFKIGKSFKVRSEKEETWLEVSLNVDEWAKSNDGTEDLSWRFPLTYGSKKFKHRGRTTISMSPLTSEAALAASDTELPERLIETASRTYGLFLDKIVRLKVNGTKVEPKNVPLGSSDDVTPASDSFDSDGVNVTILASFSTKGASGTWQDETAGWYVACNGRIVLFADKSSRTGWGAADFPIFQPQYRGFVGFAHFVSSNPLKLPWTTTKRDVNLDSPIYKKARTIMKTVARPVIKQLQTKYRHKVEETDETRSLAAKLTSTPVFTPQREHQVFNVSQPSVMPDADPKVNIQYKKLTSEIDLIRAHLNRRRMAAGKVGEHTFEYFIRSQGLK